MSNLITHDFNGVSINFQGKEIISLTDLWKASEKSEGYKPANWVRFEGKDFIDSLAKKLKVSTAHLLRTTKGRNGKTWAHWQIGLAYAKYLSPELHMWANQIVKERIEETQNPELGLSRSRERAITVWKKQGKSDEWIATRLKGMTARSFLTGTLKDHGVTNQGYAQCTNSIYEPILGGTAKEIRENKGLPVKANIRDHIGDIENIGIMLAEALAKEKIEGRNYRGNDQCSSACYVASSTVSKAIKEARV